MNTILATHSYLKKISSVILISTFLAACGGEGDDDTPDNKAPIANAGENKTVQVNHSITITGSGTDSDGSIQSYEWKSGSEVLATTASFSYTPTAVGTDTLTLTVVDDDDASASDSMDVVVSSTPVSNHAPVAIGQSIVITAGETRSITLSGTDTDGDTLTFSVVSPPTQGAFNGTAYTANANFSGTDSFTFIVNDGTIDSEIATINISDSDNTTSPTVRNSIPATPALDGVYPPMSANGGLRWEYMKNQYNNWYNRQAPSNNNNVRGASNGEAWRYDPMKTLTELCRRATLTGDDIPGACTDAENTITEFLSLQYWDSTGAYPDCSGGITGITRGSSMVNKCDFKYGGHASALHYATEIHNQTPYTDSQKEMLKEYCTTMGWNSNLWEHFTERNWGISLQCLVDLQKQGVDTSAERTSLIDELYTRTNTAGVGAPVHGLNGHEGTDYNPDPQIFSPWMGSSFLIPALWEHWVFLEKDPRIAELIVNYGDAMMEYGIVNPEEWAPDVEWHWKHGQNNTPWLTLYLAVPDDKTFNIQLQNSEGGYSDSHNPEAIFALNAAYFFSCHEAFKDRSDAMMPYFNDAIANDDPDPLSRIFLWQHRGSASTEWLLENANCSP